MQTPEAAEQRRSRRRRATFTAWPVQFLTPGTSQTLCNSEV